MTTEQFNALVAFRSCKLRIAEIYYGKAVKGEKLLQKVERLRSLRAAKDRAYSEFTASCFNQ